jgi:hypothetical protein
VLSFGTDIGEVGGSSFATKILVTRVHLFPFRSDKWYVL